MNLLRPFCISALPSRQFLGLTVEPQKFAGYKAVAAQDKPPLLPRPTQTMALTVGTRLGHYDVTAMIGSARVHHRQFVFLASTFALISPLFRKSFLKCFANASAADWKLFFFTL